VPSSYADVSDFRPVPDNQEVFADPMTDRSIIIEILEYEDQVCVYVCIGIVLYLCGAAAIFI
jgi:hypothetical protein